jgi:TPR repeat protein
MTRAFWLSGLFLVMLNSTTLAQSHRQPDPQLAAAHAAMDSGNTVLSLKLFKQAAAEGNSEALEHVAQIYLEGGNGVAKDYAAAREWAQKAADAGQGRGNLYLGQIWMNGWGTVADLDKAQAYFQKADAKGDMKGGRYVGLIAQQRGEGSLAAQWFRKAAEAGDITSQYYLGRSYETGQGVPKDYAEAMAWYTKAASRGDIIASDGMVGMAGMYENGHGVPKDFDKAVALYRQAAGLGNSAAADALKRLGR